MLLQRALRQLCRVQRWISQPHPHTRDPKRVRRNTQLQRPVHVCAQLEFRARTRCPTPTAACRGGWIRRPRRQTACRPSLRSRQREFREPFRYGLELDQRRENDVYLRFRTARLVQVFDCRRVQDAHGDFLCDDGFAFTGCVAFVGRVSGLLMLGVVSRRYSG